MFAQAISVDSAWLPYFAFLGLMLLGCVVAAGMVSVRVAKRGAAFVPGILAYAAFAAWLRIRLRVDGESVMVIGFGAAVAVGFAMRTWQHVPGVGALDVGRRRGRVDVVVVVLVLIGSLGLVVSSRSFQVNSKAVAYTRSDAESIARTLASATPSSGRDLAFEVRRREADVLKATGNRNYGGADLVLRITDTHYGMPTITQCWHFHVVAELAEKPRPVACPAVTETVISLTSFNSMFGGHFAELPADKRTDIASLRRVAQESTDYAVKGSPIRIKAARVNDHVIGVVVEVGLTDCVVTAVDSRPTDVSPAFGPTTQSWRAERVQLGQGTLGCEPKLAAQ